MHIFKRTYISAITAISILAFSPTASHAIIGIGGVGSLGEFSGTLDYSFTNSTTAALSIVLNNDSDAGNGGFITALAFNNPSDFVSGVVLTLPTTDFNLLGGATFNNTVNGAPFGQFDIGAGVGTNWEGGGTPSDGIAVGSTETFLFSLTGNNLNTLTDQSFLNALSVGPGDGEGHQSLVVRFRGFDDEGSDKVPYVVPEPATMLLFGSGLLGGIFARRRK